MPHCGDSDCSNCDCEESHDSPDYSDEEEPVQEAGRPFYDPTCDVKRLVGVEVEYNNRVSLHDWQSKWRGGVHEDGSCGYEAVTAPVAGKHIAATLIDLSRALRDSGTSCDSRCGVHVHVDASDISWHCMYRLLGAYALVEPILYLCAGQQRVNNRYAAMCGHRYGMALANADRKGAILHVATADYGGNSVLQADEPKYGREVARNGMAKKDGGRYKGLNLMPWLAARRHAYKDVGRWEYVPGKEKKYVTQKVKQPKRKDCTIEFRMHRNTLDANRLIGWATLCRDIVEWASKATDADMLSLPRSGLRALCHHIAPNSAAWVLRRVREWRAVTTASRGGASSASGVMAVRRISLRNGVYSCAA